MFGIDLAAVHGLGCRDSSFRFTEQEESETEAKVPLETSTWFEVLSLVFRV